MKCIVFIVSFLFYAGFFSYAQQFHELNFAPVPAKLQSRITILSEIHGVKKALLFKPVLINRLYDSNHVKDVILEIGKSAAYLFNEYIQTGDTTILNFFYQYRNVANRGYLFSALNRLHKEGKTIRIHGIDFERIEFVQAIEILFRKKGVTNNKLYRYIAALTDTVGRIWINSQEGRKIYNDCNRIYRDGVAYYDKFTDDGFSIKDIFDNSASEKQFTKRDAAMYRNMISLLNTGRNLLLIVGGHHVENNGKLFKKLTDQIPAKDVSVISMLCKDCEASALYFEKKRMDYLGNTSFVTDKSIAKRIFTKYDTSNRLNIIALDTEFYQEIPLKQVNGVDYIMLVDCSKSDK